MGVVGNSAYLHDDNYNPEFLTIRAKSDFVRNDTDASGKDIKAVVGEPLVKKRFALNRLCWLTYKGPSADRTQYQAGAASPGTTSADYDMWALVNLHGISPSLLKQGTKENIEKYFGLTWHDGPAGAGNPGGYWTYTHGTASMIMKLEDIAGLTGSDAREPDFFELLQASICAGSLAKTTVGRDWKNNSGKKSLIAQLKENTNIYNHIIQIGANIIDQFDLDDFPTNIVFDDGIQPRYFSGIEDLPYFYRAMELAVPTQLPVPNSTTSNQTVSPPVDWAAQGNTPGEVVDLCVPGVWNPHALRTSGATATALRPLNLRACISVFSTADPGEPFIAYTPLIGVGTYSRTSSPQTTIPPLVPTQPWITYTESVLYAPWGVGSYDPNRGCLNMPATGAAGNTAITFNNDPALYRQTTFLLQPNIPAGSGIALDSNNAVASGNATWTSGVPDINEPAKQYIGFYGGKAGLRWNNTANVTCTVQKLRQNPAHYPTISIEYYSAGTWIPYQQVMCLSSGEAWVNLGGLTHDKPVSQKLPNCKAAGDTRWDPRGRRWLTIGNVSPDSTGGSWIDSNKTIEEGYLRGAQLRTSGAGGCAFEHMAANMYLIHDFDLPNSSSPSWGLVNTAGYMIDADGVVRPGLAAYTGTDSSVGWPMATIYGNASNPSTVSNPTNVQNRPVILNRPFRSVAELGYTYSDTPWRNLDFSTPQSGNAALLDVFCIQEDKTTEGMTAGKVDLNTRQAPVLQAILAGAYRDDVLQPANSDTPLSSAEAENTAKALVARTTDTALGKGPLSNVADLVGRYVAGYANSSFPNFYSTSLYATPTRVPFAGFVDDLTSGLYPTGGLASSRVQRLRESSIRALSAAGMAGTWNLMIDLIAQTGKYPASATHLDQFVVEGEKRVWLHVAIDRQTGEIIDQQIEQVIE
jgi:hypothetical protein